MEVAVADSCMSKVAGYQVMTLALRDEEDLIIIPCLVAAQADTLVMGQLDDLQDAAHMARLPAENLIRKNGMTSCTSIDLVNMTVMATGIMGMACVAMCSCNNREISHRSNDWLPS